MNLLRKTTFTLYVTLGAYPIITLLLYWIFPMTIDWEIWKRTLLITPLMAVAMVWCLIPIIQRFTKH